MSTRLLRGPGTKGVVWCRLSNEGATMAPLQQETEWTWCTTAPDTASRKVEDVVVMSAAEIVG
eukprot:scaffold261901_cov33-Attheya_sp.AAC.1